MFPAARIGDPITHDMLVPSGVIGPQAPAPCPLCASQPVMIEMLPAAHVLCTCICTGATSFGPAHPPIPGPQPPIIKGSMTVLIHNMPAARWAPSLDVGACGVFLGDPKLAATRTVLIGDVGAGGAPGAGVGGTAENGGGDEGIISSIVEFFGELKNEYMGEDYGNGIVIKGPKEYRDAVKADLDALQKTKTGKKLLEEIGKSGKTITIKPIPSDRTQANAFAGPESDDAYINADGTSNDGSDTTIKYNPTLSLDYTGEDGNTHTIPPNEVLAHEMIHGLHNANGENRKKIPDPADPDDNLEEAQTIGVHGYENEPITERKLSEEAGRSPRPDHDSAVGMTYKDSDGKWKQQKQDASGNWTTSEIPTPAGDQGKRPNGHE